MEHCPSPGPCIARVNVDGKLSIHWAIGLILTFFLLFPSLSLSLFVYVHHSFFAHVHQAPSIELYFAHKKRCKSKSIFRQSSYCNHQLHPRFRSFKTFTQALSEAAIQRGQKIIYLQTKPLNGYVGTGKRIDIRRFSCKIFHKLWPSNQIHMMIWWPIHDVKVNVCVYVSHIRSFIMTSNYFCLIISYRLQFYRKKPDSFVSWHFHLVSHFMWTFPHRHSTSIDRAM